MTDRLLDATHDPALQSWVPSANEPGTDFPIQNLPYGAFRRVGRDEPLRIGVGVSFAFGLAMDVHQGALLGQHALAYTVLGFGAIAIHRRLLWFPVPQQALQVLPLFVVAAVIEWLTRLITQDAWPHWPQLIAPFLQTALWPVFGHVLLAPQRRPVDRDDIRPL